MTIFDERGRELTSHDPQALAVTSWVDLTNTPAAVSPDLVVQGDAAGTALEFGQNLKIDGSPTFSSLTLTDGLIGDNIVDEANLKLDTAPTDDFVLTADALASGGMKWAEPGGGANIFGSEYERFESLAQTNTGALSTDKVDATTALKPIGTYRVGFYCDITNSDGTDIWRVEFQVNGTPIHQHANGGDFYENKPDGNNDWSSESSVHYITLGAPATIDLNILFGTNDNTARAANATIEIWRVS